jgi:hypothetical protein
MDVYICFSNVFIGQIVYTRLYTYVSHMSIQGVWEKEVQNFTPTREWQNKHCFFYENLRKEC